MPSNVPQPEESTEPTVPDTVPATPEPGAQEPRQLHEDIQVRVRRSPKYSVFIVAGIVLGFIVAGVLAVLPVDTSQLAGEFTRSQAFGLLMAILGVAGGFLGAIVALLVDRRATKRARVLTVGAEYVAEAIPATAAGPVTRRDRRAAKKAERAAARAGEPAEKPGSDMGE